jgi:hypothetical protein
MKKVTLMMTLVLMVLFSYAQTSKQWFGAGLDYKYGLSVNSEILKSDANIDFNNYYGPIKNYGVNLNYNFVEELRLEIHYSMGDVKSMINSDNGFSKTDYNFYSFGGLFHINPSKNSLSYVELGVFMNNIKSYNNLSVYSSKTYPSYNFGFGFDLLNIENMELNLGLNFSYAKIDIDKYFVPQLKLSFHKDIGYLNVAGCGRKGFTFF